MYWKYKFRQKAGLNRAIYKNQPEIRTNLEKELSCNFREKNFAFNLLG